MFSEIDSKIDQVEWAREKEYGNVTAHKGRKQVGTRKGI